MASPTRLLPLLVLSMAACSFDTSVFAPVDFGDGGSESAPDGASGDVDAGSDQPDATIEEPPDASGPCPGDDIGFEMLNIDECDVPDTQESIIIDFDNKTLDTGDGTLRDGFGGSDQLAFELVTQAGGPELMVISVDRLQVNQFNRLNIVGERPLVIVSHGDIVIDGSLRASARGRRPGPGGNDAAICGLSTGTAGVAQNDGEGNSAGSGGGGGGFGSPGGSGAAVTGSNSSASPGGVVGADLDLVPLRGGCPGGDGGRNGGEGGAGGGALQLIASGRIQIDGSVSVSGGGASGVGGSSSGGAGGGSGGGLLLQSPEIEVGGIVTANGGGGSEGSRGGGFSDGGDDGRLNRNTPAAGGSGFSSGGDGGRGATMGSGAADGTEGSSSSFNAAGSGGGGGGAGVIRIDIQS